MVAGMFGWPRSISPRLPGPAWGEFPDEAPVTVATGLHSHCDVEDTPGDGVLRLDLGELLVPLLPGVDHRGQ
jgi:hypothetical protein